MKRQRKRLNQKGKVAVLILLTFVLILLIGWDTISKAMTKDATTSISAIPAKTLSRSFDSKKAFANSDLHQSIQHKKERQQEKAQHQKALKQLKKDQNHKVVYLTFDDGPTAKTDQLLNILDQYDAKATFFMLGANMKNHPSAVKRMVNEGFGVGLHGVSHDKQKFYSAKKAPVKEMTEDQQILHNITGVDSTLIRVPYGSIPYLTVEMRALLEEHAFKIWDWNVDSNDWKLKDQRFVQKTIEDIENHEQAGIAPVVLLHDKASTIDELPQLLSYLQQHDYKMKKIANDKTPLTFQCEGRCHAVNS